VFSTHVLLTARRVLGLIRAVIRPYYAVARASGFTPEVYSPAP
jgi:hypothetical protein